MESRSGRAGIHSDLSCSVTGIWLHSPHDSSGPGGRQGPGRRCELWGSEAHVQLGASLPGRGCGANRAAPPPLPHKGAQKPDARRQVFGREGSLLCTQVQKHPREAGRGVPGGGGGSGHTCVSLGLWSPQWVSKPESSSGGVGGGVGGGDKGMGASSHS